MSPRATRPSRHSALLGVLLLIGCGDGIVASFRGTSTDYLAARARWERAGVRDYVMTLRISCFCPNEGPVRMTVRDEVVISVIRVATNQEVPSQHAAGYPDIDDLFDILADALGSADVVQAEFDREHGVPRSIWIDWWSNYVDDEMGYFVDSFTATRVTR